MDGIGALHWTSWPSLILSFAIDLATSPSHILTAIALLHIFGIFDLRFLRTWIRTLDQIASEGQTDSIKASTKTLLEVMIEQEHLLNRGTKATVLLPWLSSVLLSFRFDPIYSQKTDLFQTAQKDFYSKMASTPSRSLYSKLYIRICLWQSYILKLLTLPQNSDTESLARLFAQIQASLLLSMTTHVNSHP